MKPVPANNATSDIDTLLTQFAGELASKMGVSNEEKTVSDIVSKIRWYQNKAGAVVIVKRGSDRTVLATISPKKGDWTHLYPSWERVLTQLAKEKESAGVSRLSHDGMSIGVVPLAESKPE